MRNDKTSNERDILYSMNGKPSAYNNSECYNCLMLAINVQVKQIKTWAEVGCFKFCENINANYTIAVYNTLSTVINQNRTCTHHINQWITSLLSSAMCKFNSSVDSI